MPYGLTDILVYFFYIGVIFIAFRSAFYGHVDACTITTKDLLLNEMMEGSPQTNGDVKKVMYFMYPFIGIFLLLIILILSTNNIPLSEHLLNIVLTMLILLSIPIPIPILLLIELALCFVWFFGYGVGRLHSRLRGKKRYIAD